MEGRSQRLRSEASAPGFSESQEIYAPGAGAGAGAVASLLVTSHNESLPHSRPELKSDGRVSVLKMKRETGINELDAASL